MPIIRIALLLVVLGGLTLLLVQNWSPVLPLVFLGMKTQPLPLVVWILISLTAGAFTSLLLTALFKLSNYFAQPNPRKRSNFVAKDSNAQPNAADYTAASRPASNTRSTSSDAFDDWDSDSTNEDDDWDFEDEADETQKSSSHDDIKDSTTYEVKQESKSSYQSGSVYSYSYQEPKNSGVGKTESVYDAEYRVITPPYRQTNTAKEDDDWGFEDDFDFDDSDESDSPINKGR